MYVFRLPIPYPTSFHQCSFSAISFRCSCWLQWHHFCLWTDILRENTYYGGEGLTFMRGEELGVIMRGQRISVQGKILESRLLGLEDEVRSIIIVEV